MESEYKRFCNGLWNVIKSNDLIDDATIREQDFEDKAEEVYLSDEINVDQVLHLIEKIQDFLQKYWADWSVFILEDLNIKPDAVYFYDTLLHGEELRESVRSSLEIQVESSTQKNEHMIRGLQVLFNHLGDDFYRTSYEILCEFEDTDYGNDERIKFSWVATGVTKWAKDVIEKEYKNERDYYTYREVYIAQNGDWYLDLLEIPENEECSSYVLVGVKINSE